MDKGAKGFSLIELLIVVSIILVIAAIAIPNFLRSKVAANQSSAVASLHTLEIAEMTYLPPTVGIQHQSSIPRFARRHRPRDFDRRRVDRQRFGQRRQERVFLYLFARGHRPHRPDQRL